MTETTKGNVVLTSTERVIFGQPVAEALAQEVALLGVKRVMLIVSDSLRQNTQDIAQIETALGAAHAVTFSGVAPHVPREDVIAATEMARKVDADLIVSIGGGSVTDCAKIVPICLANDIKTVEQMGDYHITVNEAGQMVNPDFKPQTIRTVCVPTTLSGGEFNPLSGATDSTTKHKQGYQKREMAPVSVILEPELTRHTPDWLWFSTGVRALDHAIETLQSYQSNDYCDGLAESALRLLIEGLPRVKAVQLILLTSLPPSIATGIAVTRLSAGMTLIGFTLAFMLPLIGGSLAEATGRIEAALIPALTFMIAALAALGRNARNPRYE